MTDADEPADVTPDEGSTAETAETRTGSWRQALPVAIALAVVAVLAVAAGVWMLADPPETPQEAEDADRQDAVLSAERFASTLTSYDATKNDQYVDSLVPMLAEGRESPCWKDVSALVPAVANSATAKAAAQRKQVYDGSVRERAVETIDPNSARVMVALDFQMSAVVKKQRSTLAAQALRVRMGLESDGDQWLVDSCTIVAPERAEGGAN